MKRSAEAESKALDLAERAVEEERQRRELEAAQAREADELIEQIDELRETLSAATKSADHALLDEIEDLLRQLGETRERAMRMRGSGQRGLIFHGMRRGGLGRVEEYISDLTGKQIMISDGVADPALGKLSVDQIRALQRARGRRR